uniref:intraflagellar transport protein 81 homolog isoform X2 n=1 Tax=Oncorhynchus gorbuscha TaxID=8017 RepID=UPI001EAF35EE|nr:intraflagellar transport protein 81 homolog isoform X2 [Oncorhynchus gorbuscha]XP_046206375.1 intraflagellar transport protein 81 homolog isoform X2 [Oncorhynchus gorbuscha]
MGQAEFRELEDKNRENTIEINLLIEKRMMRNDPMDDKLSLQAAVQSFCWEIAQQGDGVQEEEAGDYRAEHGILQQTEEILKERREVSQQQLWPVLPGVELSPDCLCGHNASQCIELRLRCQSNPWRHRSGSLGTVTLRRNWRGCRPSRVNWTK